jgi:hypothetical protein
LNAPPEADLAKVKGDLEEAQEEAGEAFCWLGVMNVL